jgi:hypothetical protein
VKEGSRVGPRSIPLTNGSGSRRAKNMWIRYIRIRILIRIRNTASKKNQDITNFDWTEAEKYCHFYAMPSVGISQINHFFNDCWHIASEINHIHLKINKHASHPFTPAQWILLRSVLLYPCPMHQHEKSFYAPLFEICRSFRVNARYMLPRIIYFYPPV